MSDDTAVQTPLESRSPFEFRVALGQAVPDAEIRNEIGRAHV